MFTKKYAKSAKKVKGYAEGGYVEDAINRTKKGDSQLPTVSGKRQDRYGDLMDFKENEIPPPSSNRLQYNLSRERK